MARIAIVGAGLLGSAVADELAAAGADVTVVEAGEPGGGTSGSSFAWVNAQDKAPEAYFALNAEGVSTYPALARSLGGDWYHPGGDIALGWGPAAAKLDDKVERHRALGYPVEDLGRPALARLEPALDLRDGELRAARFLDEAWIDAPELVRRRIARAAEGGAAIRSPRRVTGFARRAEGIAAVETDDGPIAADVVVLAAGRATEALASLAGIALPMAPSPGLLVTTRPAPAPLAHVVHAGDIAVRPDGGGRILLSSREVDAGLDPATAALEPDAEPCRELVARGERLIPSLAGVGIERVRVGIRSVATDGMPVAGYAPGVANLYLLVSHSGATLAPVLGRLVASELLGGHESRLDSYRPDRFA
jgi:glycine/D-amino acid oxidase-like deaminating enzyme